MVLATGALHLGWVCACSELNCARLSFAIGVGVRSQGPFDAEVSGFRCLPVDGETKPRLPLREAPCSSRTILDLGHEERELLSSVHSHKTSLLSFTPHTTPLTRVLLP